MSFLCKQPPDLKDCAKQERFHNFEKVDETHQGLTPSRSLYPDTDEEVAMLTLKLPILKALVLHYWQWKVIMKAVLITCY